MPISNNIRFFIFCLSCILLVSCENNRLVGLESHVKEIIKTNRAQEQVIFKMDTINSFAWDSLLFVSPYSYLSKISKKEGINLEDIPNTIQHHDSFMLVIFLNKNKGIKYIELDRTKILEQLLCDGKGYCIYPKAQSDFILKN